MSDAALLASENFPAFALMAGLAARDERAAIRRRGEVEVERGSDAGLGRGAECLSRESSRTLRVKPGCCRRIYDTGNGDIEVG